MAVIKFTNKLYLRPEGYKNVIKYIYNLDKTDGCIGGTGVLLGTPDDVVAGMSNITSFYGVPWNANCLMHAIVNFGIECTEDNVKKAENIAEAFCESMKGKHQTFYGVHHQNDDDDKLHIHFAINTTNSKTGDVMIANDSSNYHIRSILEDIISSSDI